MKFSLLTSAVLASTVTASAPMMEMQASSKMQEMMSHKTAHREAQRAKGVFDIDRYASSNATKCVNGKAGEYSCNNIDLLDHLTYQQQGSNEREGNDIWGWTSPDGREFAIVGHSDGTGFVEVLPGGQLKFIARLPTQTGSSIWRDMKVIDHHVYIGSEAQGHGVQIFDLNKLLDIKTPKTFDIKKDLTALYTGVGSSHNIVANPETKSIFIVGAGRNGGCTASNGGLVMLDVADPSKPKLTGCNGKDGYVHDAQCVVYRGVDKKFQGHEICFGYNEDTLTIYDVTNRTSSAIISRVTYDGFNGKGAYTHQGWNIDKDFKYLLLDDEQDEMKRAGVGQDSHTTTYIFDISSLANPTYTGQYKSPIQSIDHNQYIIDGISYQANYGSGLRVVDARSVLQDPTGAQMTELANFDCYPEDDDDSKAEFFGAWSVYPYFKSGTVVINCIERGLFALKVNI
ncbi:hypothetical protein VHEMI08472 [[Torrubiella] hemipterigena]|uniref:Regulatory P domain-containing protein n=1 Tax=[Torrubiella] hemipterigena TaxID=1531966 RepID=A0A0A1TDM6_9HYPO|nr:hypothetical protein VHEMI08472 [[Torrubiella] hemipterigena]